MSSFKHFTKLTSFSYTSDGIVLQLSSMSKISDWILLKLTSVSNISGLLQSVTSLAEFVKSGICGRLLQDLHGQMNKRGLKHQQYFKM